MTTTRNRILFLTTGLNRGGAEMQVFHLAKGLRARGWQAEVVSLLPGGALAGEFRNAGVPVHDLAMSRGLADPRALLRLRKIVRAFGPHMVHAHMTHANLLARLTRLICPMPALITTVHNMTEGRRWTGIAYRLSDRLSDLTTIVCQAAADRYVQAGSVPADRLKVVVNGLPVEQFRPNAAARAALRERLGIENEFVWLAVGRFEPPKDYANLMQAIARMPAKNGVFLVAGDGPLRFDIERLAAELCIRDRVRLLGIREDIAQLMAAADAYVMSSAWEGLPMVLLEASASGLPIVATHVGGNAEVVREGLSGYLVPASDPAALAAALLRMQQDPSPLRIAMGSVGREFVIKHYSLSSVLDQWASVYQEFLPKPVALVLARGAAS
jgi:glycosyltransferase involved in cell wall biosynthesis